MKKLLVTLFSILALNANAQSHREGIVLVKPKEGISVQTLDKELKIYGAVRDKKLNGLNIHEIKVPAKAERSVVRALSRNKNIEFAELDKYVAPDYLPNDPRLSSAWQIANLNPYDGWDISEGQDVLITVCDTGVNPHEDLNLKLPGYNTVLNNTVSTDIRGHGTAVAGTAAAISNNAKGAAGLAGKATILPVRITEDTANGYANFSDMAECVAYGANNGSRVSNTSYGGGGASASIASAADLMRSKGGLVVWSAGNSGNDPGYTDRDNIILVSAIASNNLRTSWSSFGAYVDFTAPGSGVLSTSWSGVSSYGTYSGTSFSSPIMAGVVAAVIAANPALSASQIDSILIKTATDIGDPGRDIYYGWGKPNLTEAVKLAKITDAQDLVAPLVRITSPSAGSTLNGTVPFAITATDNIAVASVSLKYGNTVISTDFTAPYEFLVDTTKIANGSTTFTTTAMDEAGNAATASISVFISNNDTVVPTVRITSPINGSVIPQQNNPIRIRAIASDNAGSVTQRLYINGTLVYSVVGSSLSYNWKTGNLPKGTYVIAVEAIDSAQNKTVANVTVTK